MTTPLSLKNLADTLKLRKRSSGAAYNLLLTSTISFTPDVLRQICTSKSWMQFCNYFHRIGAGTDDRINLLTEHIGIHNNLDGYRALAHLIKEGYFSTVLTTNLDSTLEDTLLETGLSATAFQTLILGRDQDKDIARILASDPIGISIIKLHGSLREKVLPSQFPDFFDFPATLQESLKHLLNQDIVIVGSLEHDEDIIRTLNARKKSHIYYALPRKSSYDTMIKLIEARGESPRTALISGAYGEFTLFFQELASILSSDISPHLIAQPALSLPRNLEQVVSNGRVHIADVLLITATEIEAQAVLDCCPGYELRFAGTRVYYDLGVIGKARIFMVQSEMGSDGPGGSRFTVEEGIRALSPCAVIMVGIAFGVDEERQHIGDILVSRQLLAYDSQRIGSDAEGNPIISLRGPRVPASIQLLDRFKAGLKTWQEPPYVHFGLMFSGAKLIANQDYRDHLRQIEKEAVGGEMEGVGLYEAAQHHHVEWIFVKAICDWADSNKQQDKEKQQKYAASNAARFTIHVLQAGGFHNLPVFKQTTR